MEQKQGTSLSFALFLLARDTVARCRLAGRVAESRVKPKSCWDAP
jgi:hypothetical protein